MTAGSMGALVYEAPEVMSYRALDVPVPGPGEVLVRVAYSGICGSELSGFLGQSALRRPPLVFGHEVSGWVEAAGPAATDGPTAPDPGTPVTVNPLASCGHCRCCLTGRQQLCPDRLLLGAHRPGTNADYVLAPARSVLPLPPGMDLAVAATVEPAAFALHAVERSGIRPGDSALVVGAGPIGLLILQTLHEHGVRTRLVAETNPARRDFAAALGGTVLHPGGGPLAETVRTATGGAGVTVAFDAVGTPGTRLDCLTSTDVGGTVVLVGLHSDDTSLPLNTVVRNELSLVGVFAYTPTHFADALTWLADGRIGLRDGVVVAPLDGGAQWYRKLVDGDPAAKVLLQPLGAPR
jgi:threonine dehydrogenase-like Zn-dependent dehydrogenase